MHSGPSVRTPCHATNSSCQGLSIARPNHIVSERSVVGDVWWLLWSVFAQHCAFVRIRVDIEARVRNYHDVLLCYSGTSLVLV